MRGCGPRGCGMGGAKKANFQKINNISKVINFFEKSKKIKGGVAHGVGGANLWANVRSHES